MNHISIEYTAPMLSRRRSLKNLLLIHEVAFLLLVAVTGALGGLSAFFWQETSSESVRINNLIFVTEQIRSELFRQIQQVIRARLTEDQSAYNQYRANSRRISELFNELRRNSLSREEAELIQDLQYSYRVIQNDMNAIFTDPYVADSAIRLQIVDPRFSQRLTAVFEGKYLRFKSNLTDKHAELDRTIAVWTEYAPILIPVFFLVALVLVLFTRHFLIHGFVRPLASIIEGAAIMRRGELEHRIPERGVEEVAEIGDALNSMAEDLSRSRDALVETERQAALGALIPVVAHNVRNPLASIRATAQMLDDVNDQEELKESRQAIMDTIDRLGRWVSALVSYLHPLKPQFRKVTASHLFESSLIMLDSKISEKKLELRRTDWELDIELLVDPDLMEQALYCLLSNAVEASGIGDEIELSMQKGANEFNLVIKDQGPGLKFSPEQGNLEPGPSTKKFGTGLGIPVAYKICQAHGWKLEFDSTSKGTRVIVSCPLDQNEET